MYSKITRFGSKNDFCSVELLTVVDTDSLPQEKGWVAGAREVAFRGRPEYLPRFSTEATVSKWVFSETDKSLKQTHTAGQWREYLADQEWCGEENRLYVVLLGSCAQKRNDSKLFIASSLKEAMRVEARYRNELSSLAPVANSDGDNSFVSVYWVGDLTWSFRVGSLV